MYPVALPESSLAKPFAELLCLMKNSPTLFTHKVIFNSMNMKCVMTDLMKSEIRQHKFISQSFQDFMKGTHLFLL